MYEVHKQYKLRTRTIDVPEKVKPNDTKQLKKIKEKAALIETVDITFPNPHQVTVEDVMSM